MWDFYSDGLLVPFWHVLSMTGLKTQSSGEKKEERIMTTIIWASRDKTPVATPVEFWLSQPTFDVSVGEWQGTDPLAIARIVDLLIGEVPSGCCKAFTYGLRPLEAVEGDLKHYLAENVPPGYILEMLYSGSNGTTKLLPRQEMTGGTSVKNLQEAIDWFKAQANPWKGLWAWRSGVSDGFLRVGPNWKSELDSFAINNTINLRAWRRVPVIWGKDGLERAGAELGISDLS